MSIFNVEISTPQITTVEIETTVGENVSNIEVITSSSGNLEITQNVALLPSDFQSSIDARLFSVIGAGEGIDINYDISEPLLTVSVSGNYATLVDGTIPSSQLPNDIYDVLEYSNLSSFPSVGEGGKIYVSLENSKIYRWGGSAYLEISASPGNTDNILEGNTNLYFTNDRAKLASPVQSVASKTGVITLDKSDVGLANVDNTSDANKPISIATQTALNARAPINGNILSTLQVGALTILQGKISGASAGIYSFSFPLSSAEVQFSNIQNIGAITLGEWRSTPVAITYGGTGASSVSGALSNFGLNNVNNTSDSNKPISIATQIALNEKAAIEHTHTISDISNLQNSLNSKQPSGNYAASAHNHLIEDITGLSNSLNSKAPINNPVFTGVVSGINKSMVGLNNVDNTSDLSKPVSVDQANADSVVQNNAASDATAKANTAKEYAIQRANHTGTQAISTIDGLQESLNGKQTIGTYATLVNGTVPSSQLPSYVDDVMEYASLSGFPPVGESSKIYVSLDNNKIYRWGGSIYIEISPSPGSTDSISEGSLNKYYTDTRASAAAPVQSVSGRIGNIVLTKDDIGLGNIDNTSDANKPISIATQSGLNLKSSVGHTHTYSDISNFSTGVDSILSTSLIAGSNIVLNYDTLADTLSISTSGLQPAGDYANAAHTHSINNINGLQTALDNKQTIGNYATNTDITNLQTQINNKQPSGNYSLVGHQHISSDISDFENRVVSIVATGVPLEYLATSVLVHNNPTDVTGNFSNITKEYIHIFTSGAVGYKLILPTAISNKAQYTLKNKTSDTIYLYPQISQTIDGYDSIGLNINNMSISVISDGSNWTIV